MSRAWGAIVVASLASGVVIGNVACRRGTTGVSPASSASASASSVASAAPSSSEGDPDTIRPVYPEDGQPPLALATTYCDAVVERPRVRRQACCPGFGGFAPTAECARTLSSALRAGAVSIDETALKSCVEAATRATDGCDWIGPFGGATPAACLGIIRGLRPSGAVCRSSLECAEGSRCYGLGATRAGRCAVTDDRHGCNLANDTLASFTGQQDFERHHAECPGVCARTQCLPALALGAPCTMSVHCGPNAVCVAGQCANAKPELGKPCTDVCAGDLHCVGGVCAEPKADGARCATDAECRAYCQKGDAGTAGICAPQCPSFPMATAKSATPPPK